MKLINFNREHVPENSEIEKLLVEFGYGNFPIDVYKTNEVGGQGEPLVKSEGKNLVSIKYFITKE